MRSCAGSPLVLMARWHLLDRACLFALGLRTCPTWSACVCARTARVWFLQQHVLRRYLSYVEVCGACGRSGLNAYIRPAIALWYGGAMLKFSKVASCCVRVVQVCGRLCLGATWWCQFAFWHMARSRELQSSAAVLL